MCPQLTDIKFFGQKFVIFSPKILLKFFNDIVEFLAAMSSSSSDNVTQSVRSFVCPWPFLILSMKA